MFDPANINSSYASATSSSHRFLRKLQPIYSRHNFGIVLMLLQFSILAAHAQERPPEPPEVEIELNSREFKHNLPFHEKFRLTGTTPDGVVQINLKLFEAEQNNGLPSCCCSKGRNIHHLVWNGDDDRFYFSIKRLELNTHYCFQFQSYRRPTEDVLAGLRDRLTSLIDQEFRQISHREPKFTTSEVCQNTISIVPTKLQKPSKLSPEDFDHSQSLNSLCQGNSQWSSWYKSLVTKVIGNQIDRHKLIDEIEEYQWKLDKNIRSLVANLRHHEMEILNSQIAESFKMNRPLMGLLFLRDSLIMPITRGLDSFVQHRNRTPIPFQVVLNDIWAAEEMEKLQKKC